MLTRSLHSMEPTDQRLNIAVVGTGVAGLTAAWLLARRHDVTLFEKNDYPGGHTHTIVVPGGPDAGTPVDTGFIVMNHRNYPLFTRLLEQLRVPLRDSDMSFGFHDRETGLQYAGTNLNTMFAQRRNLLSPSFHRMIRDVLRFYRESPRDLNEGKLAGLTLGDYLKRGAYSAVFVHQHIIPMGAAIWSTASSRMMEFSAENFIHFFRNHGLLGIEGRPQWRTVAGGSHTYVKAMLKSFPQPVRLKSQVDQVLRRNGRVSIETRDGTLEWFDRVVIAAHADEALDLLADPSGAEERLLGAWSYERNHTLLHSDVSVLPPNRRAWASWNYARECGARGENAVSVTYDMKRLQGLDTRARYLVTLNRVGPVAAASVVREMWYTHPVFSFEALKTQAELPKLNGERSTYFCGSYFGYGFHEDAVRSGVEVARAFGIEL